MRLCAARLTVKQTLITAAFIASSGLALHRSCLLSPSRRGEAGLGGVAHLLALLMAHIWCKQLDYGRGVASISLEGFWGNGGQLQSSAQRAGHARVYWQDGALQK